MARGFSGRVAAMPLRKPAMPSQVSAGFQSMKKQGPAPWGMKKVGMRVPAPVAGAPVPWEGGVLSMSLSMGTASGDENRAIPNNTSYQ